MLKQLAILIIAIFHLLSTDSQAQGSQGFVVVVKSSSQHQTIKDIVALKNKNCGTDHLSTQLGGGPKACQTLNQRTGMQAIAIPYRNASSMLVDLQSDQVDFGVLPIETASEFLRGGKIRAIVVSSTARVSEMPGIPTLSESGFK